MKMTKRIATMALSLVMLLSLLPLGTTVSAATIEKDPFYMVNISGTGDMPNIYQMSEFYCPAIKSTDDLYIVQAYDSTYPDDIAAAMKEDFDERPEGARYIQFNMLRRAAQGLNDSIVYLDDAIEFTKNWVTEFLKEYKKIGGKLDGIIVDVEYEHIESHYIYNWVYKPGNERGGIAHNQNIYNDIVNDPRYATKLRPMLEERGFKFWPNPSGDKSEIWGISGQAGAEYSNCQSIWDNVIMYLMAEAVNESVTAPLLKYYPDAIVSDYQTPDFKAWQKHFYDGGSIRTWNSPKAGNSSNFNTYNNRINNGVFGSESSPKYSNIVGYNNAVFSSEPFSMLLWDVNMFRKMYEATDNGKINAWIAGYNNTWGNGNTCTTCNTPYYTETLYHMGLMAMTPSFIGYVVPGEEQTNYKPTMQVISEVLTELTRVAGASDRAIIAMPVNWNGNYVLSGMYAGGRNIWRITPNINVVSLEDFKVKDKAPTFSVDGYTITFPQGRIIEDSSISKVGSCGYWVETPVNVMPVITAEKDRYANNPSFEENFQQYSAGTTLSAATASPKNIWEVSGSALKVQANGSNKALAMTGTASLTNVKLPQNITAGDSYANQQAWEVSFTLPANLSANAALQLLSCADNDGGIKISGGKMYYDEAGAYKELSGVSLSAGTYTVKREVDFRTSGKYTSSYSIYDSNGALIKAVNNVAMGTVSVPVTQIKIACENVNENILIDDYKLYPTGITTEFELYDVDLGNKLTDHSQARTKDTAYRLAWMNTTNENKIAYVYDAKAGTIIAKVAMPAGRDGVATGVVEAASGESIQLAVRVGDGAATTQVNYDNGDFSWPTMEQNFGKTDNGGNTVPPVAEPTPSEETEPDNTQPNGTEATQPNGTEATEPNGTEATQPNSTEATEPGNTQPNGTEATEPNVSVDEEENTGLSGGQVALILVIAVLLVGGGVAALWFVSNKKEFRKLIKKLTGKKVAASAAAKATEPVEAAEATETVEATETTETTE